ncbi:hypothetical protein IAR55_001813 [Kwoniella newhampshirensis]|uniref:Major facilitator superfamily (MFS) profile domain-containing protein n=1 Tax=Kwoniella newhampshirensis TaxID=1651941 RepID=A0AAW0Z355_9TREE
MSNLVPPDAVDTQVPVIFNDGSSEKAGDLLSKEGVIEVKESDDISRVDEEEYSDAEYKRVRWKSDLILLPLMFWCYGIQLVDKTGMGTMNLYGMQKDTGMKGRQYSLLTVMFYVAYAIFEFPSTWILQRFSLGRVLSLYMFIWGCIVLGQAFGKNWATFMVLRFLQGAFECIISPGFNFIIASWYTTGEHSSRALFFQSANAGWDIVIELVMYAIGQHEINHPGGFRAWRAIGIFLGGQTILASAVCYLILGTPNEVRWLSDRDRKIVNRRVIINRAGLEDGEGGKIWKWDQVKEAFIDPVTYFQFVNTFLSCIANGALSTFGTVVFAGFGFSNAQVVIYTIPIDVAMMVWFALVAGISLKWANTRLWFMAISGLPTFVGLLTIPLLPAAESYRWVKYGMYLMTATYTVCVFSAWTLISSNCVGKTKRTVVSSLVFIAYCTGNIAGSQVMNQNTAPRYIPGTIGCAICLGAEVVLILLWRVYLVYANRKKRNALDAQGLTEEEIARRGEALGKEDTTDLKNPYFL